MVRQPYAAASRRYAPRVLLVVTDERFAAHDPGIGHPERPARLVAARAGLGEAGVDDAFTFVAPRAATDVDLLRVHRADLLERITAIDRAGGGRIDADTAMNAASLDAARLAAGAVLTAVEELATASGATEERTAAYCIVRPPGHHATPDRAMGFCVFNSVAVAAATLADAGQRVAIVDIDAHHGNGTQDTFVADDRVLYASIHQSPLYPGTGGLTEQGRGVGAGSTLNVPLPAGATGDVARTAIDEVIGPVVEAFAPDWLLLSVGYDGHRADPLTDLGYTSADYADLVTDLVGLVPPGRTVAVLEGGYDLDAVRHSSAAVTAALLGVRYRPETPSTGGPGRDVVAAARVLHLGDGR